MFRELVRKHKELPKDVCIEVLKNETRGVLSVLGDNDYPYGMPMNHFYNEADGKIYFHWDIVSKACKNTTRYHSAVTTRVIKMTANGIIT